MQKKKPRAPQPDALGECGECAELESWVGLYLEGEAPAEIKQHLLIHIQTCRACARLVRTVQRTIHFCRLEPGWDVPSDVHERLWTTIKHRLKPQGTPTPHPGPAAGRSRGRAAGKHKKTSDE